MTEHPLDALVRRARAGEAPELERLVRAGGLDRARGRAATPAAVAAGMEREAPQVMATGA